MASPDLRAELECSVCLNFYTDAVTLRCGHNYCRVCIDCVLDTQEGCGGFSCPECRERFKARPALQRNIKLCNIVENFLSAQPDLEESRVFCTYCVDSPVPAVKSCLLCEASLCDKHLKVHNKSPEHVLCDPTTSLENRKCSIHKETFKYYCIEDSTCICVSCCLIGEHKGHEMVSLEEASEKRKKKLKNVLRKIITEREKTEKKVRSFREHGRKVQEQADGETRRATALFIELRRRLEDLEKRVLSNISGQKAQISSSLSDLIQLLETKKDELSTKMRHIEELCNMTDPLTVLHKSGTDDLCDTEEEDNEDRERDDTLLNDGKDLDVFRLSHTLHTGLSDIITWINEGIHIPEPADISLDVNTASNNFQISDDRKVASWSENSQNRPETPERFNDCAQVISCQRFSSGRHYWDVNVGRSRRWRIGVCYPSMDRRGEQSRIGNNNKSWVIGVQSDLFSSFKRMFEKRFGKMLVIHDSKKIPLPAEISTERVRIYLDYEAGRISLYDLSDPIRHLHTFTATFTEPLHAALSVDYGCIKISGGDIGRCEKSTQRLVTS
ncbi:PREDICTED: E3 ubiquitin/ISG15 ligase TRIM25-like [Nanorana parkeri]|uniref:E3 ubiquitin/ISG15 ligase TRIM25-like n=1 Tax=Nanorana parkeri TaxID=125878 RepID=UPI000854FB9F|nr:PREDICTED: E3 ubiquitin/ISG15 ligase TRIM25-like [Nanorana parkeri]